MKKFFVIIIAFIALTSSLIAYSSLIPNTPVTQESDDLMVNDILGGSSSVSSSSETTMADELTEVLGTDADTLSSSATTRSSMSSSTIAVEQKPSNGSAYLAYTDGIIGNGETSLLFFYASTCPSCQQSDANLKALYSQGTPTVNTYRIDFDTALDLRKKYGVTEQHTFVLIDGKGTALQTLLGATADQLSTILVAR